MSGGAQAGARGYGREIIGLFLLFCSLLLLLSLATFDLQDPSFNHAARVASVHNKGGLFGAYVSGFLNDAMGTASLLLPLVIGGVGTSFLSHSVEVRWWRWLGCFLIGLTALAGSSAANLHVGDLSGGGLIGSILAALFGTVLSPFGAFLFFVFLFCVGVQLFFEISWKNLVNDVRERMSGLAETYAAEKAAGGGRFAARRAWGFMKAGGIAVGGALGASFARLVPERLVRLFSGFGRGAEGLGDGMPDMNASGVAADADGSSLKPRRRRPSVRRPVRLMPEEDVPFADSSEAGVPMDRTFAEQYALAHPGTGRPEPVRFAAAQDLAEAEARILAEQRAAKEKAAAEARARKEAASAAAAAAACSAAATAVAGAGPAGGSSLASSEASDAALTAPAVHAESRGDEPSAEVPSEVVGAAAPAASPAMEGDPFAAFRAAETSGQDAEKGGFGERDCEGERMPASVASPSCSSGMTNEDLRSLFADDDEDENGYGDEAGYKDAVPTPQLAPEEESETAGRDASNPSPASNDRDSLRALFADGSDEPAASCEVDGPGSGGDDLDALSKGFRTGGVRGVSDEVRGEGAPTLPGAFPKASSYSIDLDVPRGDGDIDDAFASLAFSDDDSDDGFSEDSQAADDVADGSLDGYSREGGSPKGGFLKEQALEDRSPAGFRQSCDDAPAGLGDAEASQGKAGERAVAIPGETDLPRSDSVGASAPVSSSFLSPSSSSSSSGIPSAASRNASEGRGVSATVRDMADTAASLAEAATSVVNAASSAAFAPTSAVAASAVSSAVDAVVEAGVLPGLGDVVASVRTSPEAAVASGPAPAVSPASQEVVRKESAPLQTAEVAAAPKPAPIKPWKRTVFQLPPLELLDEPRPRPETSEEDMKACGEALMSCLHDFNVMGELICATPGPVVTTYMVRPNRGVSVRLFTRHAEDIARSLMAVSVFVQAPVPGTDTVGIVIPNRNREVVNFRDIASSETFAEAARHMALPIIIGKDTTGAPFVADLAKTPHLLVAGATGQGKSVCLNALLTTLLMTKQPSDLRLVLVDPKRVEMGMYEEESHLIHPVVKEVMDAKSALQWAVHEMDRRYDMMSKLYTKHIRGYNEKLASFGDNVPPQYADMKPMPYVVIVIDELADLMLQARKEVEPCIIRLAQLARAAGMHMIIATQRPSVDVVTGLIKANFPCRICFKVSSGHDSSTALGSAGAENLLGMGDMFFLPNGGNLTRLHGPFLQDHEVQAVVDYWKRQKKAEYEVDFSAWGSEAEEEAGGGSGSRRTIDSSDALYASVLDFVQEKGSISTSLLQRRFNIGFNKAARYIDQLEQDGIVGPSPGAGKPRPVIR